MQHVPRTQRHAKVPGHGDDVALKIAEYDAPATLVDGERGFAVVLCVCVGSCGPGGTFGDAELEDGAGFDEHVEGFHAICDGSCVVPSVKVEDV